MYIGLYVFLQDNKLLLDTQFGFRKNHSCQTALITLAEVIYNAIQSGNLFGLLQLDLSEAFDLVNHTLLLVKLKLYHCNADTICWFQSYLKNRSQRVSVKSSLSQPQTINSGVPQGSILGPLLFLTYINDMPLIFKRINTMLYADDATISASGKHIVDIENTLSDSGNSASDWCLKNDMILSLPKCNTLIISSKKQPLSLNVDIDGTIIPNLSTAKILGVHFDNVMSWDKHIKAIRNKITQNLYLLQQIKSFLPVNARKLFVNSYILPHIDYCSVVWGNCSKTFENSLEKLLTKSARLILDEVLDRQNTTPSHVLYTYLSWMSIPERINYHRAVQVYKCLNGMCDQGMNEMFRLNRQVHKFKTRAAGNHNIHVSHSHCKSFLNLGTQI